MLKIIDSYFGILIMMFGIICFAKIILNEKIKVSKIKLSLVILISSVAYTLLTLYADGVEKTLIIVLLNIITFMYLFEIDYSTSITLTLLYITLLLIPEILVLIILEIGVNIPKTLFCGGIIGNTIIYILFLPLVYIARKQLNKFVNYKINKNAKILIFSILTFVCISVVFYNAFININPGINLIVSIFMIIVFICILLNLMKEMINNSKLIRKYEQILEFMTTYEDEVEKQRVLRHETKNAFLSIKAQLTDKTETQEIINYIDSILEDDVKIKNEEYAKFKYLPANGIKGLCYYKIQEAENRNIKVSINISSRIKKSSLSKLSVKEIKELGKILGVYLDNAIEASVKSEDKKLGFEAYLIDNKVKIIISNTYKGELSKEKIGNEIYSTKGKNRGHGLLLVKEIVSNNKMFNIDTEITDSLYIQSLTIEK